MVALDWTWGVPPLTCRIIFLLWGLVGMLKFSLVGLLIEICYDVTTSRFLWHQPCIPSVRRSRCVRRVSIDRSERAGYSRL